jgi:hypothetical protein
MSQQDLNDLLADGSRSLDPAVGPLIPEQLKPLQQQKNGFYAYGPALYVRPWGADIPGNCLWWNAVDTWRHEHPGLDDENLFFFAEDIYGFQFAIHSGGGIYQVDPETADRELRGKDVYEWASALMGNLDFYTGRQVADQWQELNGPLPVGARLAPPGAFSLGCEFEAEGLNAISDVELMRFRGHLYTQTKDLPNGATVKLSVD